MKKLIVLASLVFASQTFAQVLIQKSGTSGLVQKNGTTALIIFGHAADKINSGMTGIRAHSNGLKEGTDIVCEGRIRGRNQAANKRCAILISDARLGTIGLGGGFSRNDVSSFGDARAYHHSGSTGFGMIEISGGEGSPASILWKALARSSRSGVGKQKAGNRYTCDKFEHAGGDVKFRCEFSLDRMSDGTIGLGGVG